MATNTKRGLFRIWLVVSVPWLCLMTFLAYGRYEEGRKLERGINTCIKEGDPPE